MVCVYQSQEHTEHTACIRYTEMLFIRKSTTTCRVAAGEVKSLVVWSHDSALTRAKSPLKRKQRWQKEVASHGLFPVGQGKNIITGQVQAHVRFDEPKL